MRGLYVSMPKFLELGAVAVAFVRDVLRLAAEPFGGFLVGVVAGVTEFVAGLLQHVPHFVQLLVKPSVDELRTNGDAASDDYNAGCHDCGEGHAPVLPLVFPPSQGFAP